MNIKNWVFRGFFYLLFFVLFAYLIEFFWVASDKGQSSSDYAWEIVAQEILSQQDMNGIEMRISGGKPSRVLCDFWSFESVFGLCVTIGVAIKNYHPKDRLMVEQKIEIFLEKMRTPCVFLPMLDLKDKLTIAKQIGCGGWKNKFKIRIWVNSVTVSSDKGPVDRPNRWSLKTIEHLYSTSFSEGVL